MIFEFVVVYRREEGMSIHDILTDRIGRVLADNLNEVDSNTLRRIIGISFERNISQSNGEAVSPEHQILLSFTIDLPDETESIRTVVDEFADELQTSPIEHVVKFEDPLLHQELAQYAQEIFALEMKLRRVLSVIYLSAYQGNDPYDLLREEAARPMAKEQPTPAQMQAAIENQFFHLTFSQYVGLNRRPDITKVPSLVELIRVKETYEALRSELERVPVGDEDDAVFIAGLKERMEAIEAMRNCVAHNRRPSKRIVDNYVNVLPELEMSLDDIISQWSQVVEDEMFWDTEARKAVEQAMESASWEDENRKVIFNDSDDHRSSKVVSSREELESYLGELARSAFYANAPHDEEGFVFECDEDAVVHGVLSNYEDRLASFFGEIPGKVSESLINPAQE